MDPVKVSAQFAAWVWFSNQHGEGPHSQDRATRFTQQNWPAFLPLAHKGIGRLLIQIAARRASRQPWEEGLLKTNGFALSERR